ncbi:MAG: HD domain-containing protein [Treponema sp.]|jgi:poly(A) polymerase|nr:HD domain-containing protein [Treponema sp.]
MKQGQFPGLDARRTTRQEGGPLDLLVSRGYEVHLRAFSAIDRYLGWDTLSFVLADTDAPLSSLARLFEELRFPGAAMADAAVTWEGRDYLFRCPDSGAAEKPAYRILHFAQDWASGRFYDPWGFYPLLRRFRREFRETGSPRRPGTPESQEGGAEDSGSGSPPWWDGFDQARDWPQAAVEGAQILARYGGSLLSSGGGPGVSFSAGPGIPRTASNRDSFPPRPQLREPKMGEIAALIRELPAAPLPGPAEQRMLLTGLLDSPRPDLGFEFLKLTGIVERCWPELSILDDVDHSKEFHPEGNVWKHTLETFRHRKGSPRGGYDLRLSLALLLHDSGKPLSESSGGQRFRGHAELGAIQARRFLDRLGFAPAMIADVAWLVKNHMLPAAMPRLPLIRTQEIMEAPLFSTLMELYRCDESSSFKGLDGYYKSSAAYQSYLKHRRNPYRGSDGKKLGKRFL